MTPHSSVGGGQGSRPLPPICHWKSINPTVIILVSPSPQQLEQRVRVEVTETAMSQVRPERLPAHRLDKVLSL